MDQLDEWMEADAEAEKLELDDCPLGSDIDDRGYPDDH